MKTTAFLLVTIGCVTAVLAEDVPEQSAAIASNQFKPGADALDEALALVGISRADLGWAPKGWWRNFPQVPYKLRAFDSLFCEPLDSITFARALAQSAWVRLDPDKLDEDQARSIRNLYSAVHELGVNPKFGGLRGYCPNLFAEDIPLAEAVLMLTRAADRPTRISTFGMELPYPTVTEDLADKASVLPEGVGPIIGRLIVNIIDAHYWAELAFRKVDPADRLVVSRRYNFGDEMTDAYDYCPEVDDVARVLDEASLWYAGGKCVQAMDDARVALKALSIEEMPEFSFDWETPWGWIRIRGGGNDLVSGKNSLLIVDLGGNDTYSGEVAASTAHRPISLLIDMEGDDRYISDEPAQGAGLCGVGILIDQTGNDRYQARRYAQGAGQFGLGLLADLGGNDEYFNRFSGQGCGYFGVGLLFDTAGNDKYTIWGDGQGLGGAGGGIGVLADRCGNDRYTATREHSVTRRPSYHSPDNDVCVSNAQGCGMGRRGDGGDGHSWAGGIGALLDSQGDDVYTSGNWCMGTGYWFGVGVLHDRSGNDEYHGVAYSQGSGAHFCVGVMVDETGDDRHLTEENSHISLAWGHDFTVAVLLDASGNDVYSVDDSGMAYSINRSVALLLDLAGDDTYKTKKVPRPGFAKEEPRFREKDGVVSYFADTTSIGLFLDIGGVDTYWGDLKNNHHWLDDPESPNWKDRNFSVGVDRERGDTNLLPTPQKAPSRLADDRE